MQLKKITNVCVHTHTRAHGECKGSIGPPSRNHPAGRQSGSRFTTYSIYPLWLNSSQCVLYRQGGCGRGAEGPSCIPRVCVCVCIHIHLWYFLIALNCIKFYINLNCLPFFYLSLICLFFAFFFSFIHVYNFQRDKRFVIVHGVRKLSSIYKTSFVNNFLINNEWRLKPPARYSGQWPWQHMSRLLGLGPLFGIFTDNCVIF